MAIICPTVLAGDAHHFREQMDRIEPFAARIQIDLMDGKFVPDVPCINLSQAWWPKHLQADLHLMYQDPNQHISTICKLKPSMVIVHAEADGDFMAFAAALHAANIRVGVAILAETDVETIVPALDVVDHVLIFSGHLGHFGGSADTALLTKAQAVKELKPEMEIGWDGGINDTNVHMLAAGGIDVLNVGGYIQKASDPANAYATLLTKLN